MVFDAIKNIFSKKCPVCRMPVAKGNGIEAHGEIFCSKACKNKYDAELKKKTETLKKMGKPSCCH